jgi:hypothetical protein
MSSQPAGARHPETQLMISAGIAVDSVVMLANILWRVDEAF